MHMLASYQPGTRCHHRGSFHNTDLAPCLRRSSQVPVQARAHVHSSMVFAESRVSFKNSSKEQLVGRLLDAKGDEVVILCHGFAASKDGFHFSALADELAKRKLSSLRFDFAGNGESQGTFEFGNYAKEVEDIRAAVLYVREKLKKKVLALVAYGLLTDPVPTVKAGHSKGGNDVLLYAATYDDVPFVVNISGRFDMKKGITQRFGEDIFEQIEKLGQIPQVIRTDSGATVKWMLTKRSMDERLSTDMAAAASKIALTEVLTVHGSADPVIPVEDAHQFSKRIRQHKLQVVQGADHNYRDPVHAAQLIKLVVDYLTSGV